MTQSIVAIHGLWMNGMEMSLLRRRLRSLCACETYQFSYHSLGRNLAQNIRHLAEFIERQSGSPVHIAAHSLGGVLALQTLRAYPDLNVGRVVCLGSPLVDSAAARQLLSMKWSRKLVGRTLRDALIDQPLIRWDGPAEVAGIAGTVPLGLGRWVVRLARPNDGAVEVAETRLPGMAAHIEMPVNHFGLVLSSAVATRCADFIRTGQM